MRVAEERGHDGFRNRHQRFQHAPTWLAVPCEHAGIIRGFPAQDFMGECRLGSYQVVSAVNMEGIFQDATAVVFVVSHSLCLSAARLFIQQQDQVSWGFGDDLQQTG